MSLHNYYTRLVSKLNKPLVEPTPTPEILQLQSELARVRKATLKSTDVVTKARLDIRAREINTRIRNIKFSLLDSRGLPLESF